MRYNGRRENVCKFLLHDMLLKRMYGHGELPCPGA